MKMLYDNSEDLYNSSNQQRMNRHKRASSDAFLSAPKTINSSLQRFIESVKAMNDTIMVPCRLLDMEMTASQNNKPLPPILQGGQDPYVIYGVLNSTKNDLVYGLPGTQDEEDLLKEEDEESEEPWSSRYSDTSSTFSAHSATNSTAISQSSTNANNSNSNTISNKPYGRKTSTLSMLSLGSSTGSCDSGTGTDTSDITEEVENTESFLEPSSTNTVAQTSAELRSHLSGLFQCLNQLSDTADYLTDRYQEELANSN